jgi:quercetin dioxygenase-like cupin family protein
METITEDGIILAYIARGGTPPSRTEFLTPHECNLQVGHVVYPAGSEIPRHIHLPVERRLEGSTEVIIVQQGRCQVDVYNDARQMVATRDLHVGDILISVAGGHGFRVLEDTVLLEVKQGPYPGDALVKARF